MQEGAPDCSRPAQTQKFVTAPIVIQTVVPIKHRQPTLHVFTNATIVRISGLLAVKVNESENDLSFCE